MRRIILLTLIFCCCLTAVFAQHSGTRLVEERTIPMELQGERFSFEGEAQIPFSDRLPFITLAFRLYGVDEQKTSVEVMWEEGSSAVTVERSLTFETHGPHNDLFKVSELIYLPQEVQDLRYRIVTADPAPIDMELHWFVPSEVYTLQNESFPAPASRSCPLPSYVTRTGWNCPSGQAYSNGTPSYTTVSHLVVHHSAGSNSSSNWAAVVLSIWNYHRFTNGWDDIAYNVLIDPNGVIYEGRGGNAGYTLDVISAATCGSNSGSMAVCLLGNYELTAPSTLAIASLQSLLAWKAALNGIDAAGSSSLNNYGVLDHIFGHRQGCSTACPGQQLYDQLPSIRTAVASAVSAGCSPAGMADIQYAAHTEDDNTDGDSNGDGDGKTEPGETIEVFLTLENTGELNATNAVASVTTEASCVSFIDNDIFFGTINASSNATEGDLDIVFSSSCSPGQVPFYLTVTADQGVWLDTFYIEVFEDCLLPVAAFTADVVEGPAPLEVQFTSLSTDAIAFQWLFPGSGSPTASTAENPSVTYTQPGTYDVSLTVFNECGSDAVTMAGMINVGVVSSVSEFSDLAKLYPNPVQDQLHLVFDQPMRNDRLTVMDASGRVVYTGPVSGTAAEVPVQHLAPGIYWLSVREKRNGRHWATTFSKF